MDLRQSTEVTIKFGPMVDDTDGKTAETGLTIAQADVRLSKAGGDMAQKHGAASATHDEIGYYDIVLDTTDTNTLGILDVMVHKSGALPRRQSYMVKTANRWDSEHSTDLLQVDVTQLLGTAWLTPGTAGTPDVNVKLISGDATAADNCEADYDGTGYAGGTIVKGADVTKISGDATAADNLEAACDGNTYNVGGGAIVASSVTTKTGYQLAADQAVNATKIGGTTQTGRDLGTSVLISSGTGTGQLDVTSGVIKANLAQILGTALTETAGYLAAGFKKFFNIETPASTVASVNQTGDNYPKVSMLPEDHYH